MGLRRIAWATRAIGRSEHVLLAVVGVEEKMRWLMAKPRPLEKAAILVGLPILMARRENAQRTSEIVEPVTLAKGQAQFLTKVSLLLSLGRVAGRRSRTDKVRRCSTGMLSGRGRHPCGCKGAEVGTVLCMCTH